MTGFKHYLMMVTTLSQITGIQVDRKRVSTSNWVTFVGSDPVHAGKVHELPNDGVFDVAHTGDVKFGLLVYGSGLATCTYAYPAGWCYHPKPEDGE